MKLHNLFTWVEIIDRTRLDDFLMYENVFE